MRPKAMAPYPGAGAVSRPVAPVARSSDKESFTRAARTTTVLRVSVEADPIEALLAVPTAGFTYLATGQHAYDLSLSRKAPAAGSFYINSGEGLVFRDGAGTVDYLKTADFMHEYVERTPPPPPPLLLLLLLCLLLAALLLRRHDCAPAGVLLLQPLPLQLQQYYQLTRLQVPALQPRGCAPVFHQVSPVEVLQHVEAQRASEEDAALPRWVGRSPPLTAAERRADETSLPTSAP